jgi:hypothetical protein
MLCLLLHFLSLGFRGLVGVDVDRINDFFVSRPSSSGQLVLEAHSVMNVPVFSFINVDSTEVNDPVLSIISNAAGVDEILFLLLEYFFWSFFLH